MAGRIALQSYQGFIVLQLGGLMAGGWPKAGGINHVKPRHPRKTLKQRKPCFSWGEDHVPQKCRFKDDANRKGTLPWCAKRRFQPRVQSRIAGNNQLGMWKLANKLQTIKTTNSSCSKSVKKSLNLLSCFQ